MKKHILSIIITIIVWILALYSLPARAQEPLTQTIRGQIVDTDTRSPLPGATIMVVGSEPLLATTTDMDGYFVLPKVPVGKVDILIRYLGYEEQLIPGVVVSSGKETQLNLSLQESFKQLDIVEVTPDSRDPEDFTEMSIVSSTTFSVEEARRSPGSFNDPSRMASTFAGVSTDPQGNNDIVVRGNSPKGIQWRLDGIEIPNPNHFADEGATGGAINVINSDMLSNSNFYTGAFAPEYGNAYSGIMDLELRTGNKGKREYSITAGVLGLEASAEGPFVKGKRSSYLVNYRYSTLTLLDQIGLVDYGGVPEYQDGLFKFHMPTKKAGVFSVFGVGGFSQIQDESENDEGKIDDRFLFKSFMGVVGIKHSYPINNNTYISTDYSTAINGNFNEGEELDEDNNEFFLYYKDNMKRYTNALNTAITHKFNSRHTLKAGVGMRLYTFNYEASWTDDEDDAHELKTYLKEKGNATLLNAYGSWKYRITENLTMVSGLHYQHFMLNNAFSIEPRASIKWQFTEKQSLFGGMGLHSKLETLTNYFSLVPDEFGNTSQPNKDLKLAKSAHFVVGYENRLTPHMSFKVELYYQHLFHVPVEDNDTSHISLLNSVGYFTDVSLVNEGTGKNYGVELTLNRTFARQYYFTFTASLYESKYTALDGIERNTVFNGNFSLNAIGGKEFNVGKPEKHRTVGITARLTWAGGPRYTPILLPESILAGEEVLDTDNRYSRHAIDFYKLNLAVYYTRDRKRVTHTIKLDIENVTNHQAKLFPDYNDSTHGIEYSSQMPILPVVRYTLQF